MLPTRSMTTHRPARIVVSSRLTLPLCGFGPPCRRFGASNRDAADDHLALILALAISGILGDEGLRSNFGYGSQCGP